MPGVELPAIPVRIDTRQLTPNRSCRHARVECSGSAHPRLVAEASRRTCIRPWLPRCRYRSARLAGYSWHPSAQLQTAMRPVASAGKGRSCCDDPRVSCPAGALI
jgi:hypothetical protein